MQFDIRDRQGEAQAFGALLLAGVHADDSAVQVKERPAAVARVERGVELNHVDEIDADFAVFGFDPIGETATEPADDAGGDGTLETAKRTADGDDLLAGSQEVGAAEFEGGVSARLGPQYDRVHVGIPPDHVRLQESAVDHHDADRILPLYDVIVGQQQAG